MRHTQANPVARTGKKVDRRKMSDQSGKGSGLQPLQKHIQRHDQSSKSYTFPGFDPVPDVVYVLEEKKPEAQLWLTDFFEKFDLPVDFKLLKKPLWETIKKFVSRNDFVIEKKDTLVELIKRCSDYTLSQNLRYYQRNAELIEVEHLFDSEDYVSGLSFDVIDLIAKSNPLLARQLYQVYLFILYRFHFAFTAFFENSEWRMDMALEEYEYAKNELKESTGDIEEKQHLKERLKGELYYVMEMKFIDHMSATLSKQSLFMNLKREKLIRKWLNKGVFHSMGINAQLKKILTLEPNMNLLEITHEEDSFKIVELSGDGNRYSEGPPVEITDAFMIGKYFGTGPDTNYQREISEQAGNCGGISYYRAIGDRTSYTGNDHVYQLYCALYEMEGILTQFTTKDKDI